jgi:hypothetical protein
MREITTHHTNEANKAIVVIADDRDPDNGNASHMYDVSWRERDDSGMSVEIPFQHGPIKESGINGLTNEVLLAIVIDRLEGFQSSKYACRENAIALTKLQEAAHWLEHRTKAREARGVEGTNKV